MLIHHIVEGSATPVRHHDDRVSGLVQPQRGFPRPGNAFRPQDDIVPVPHLGSLVNNRIPDIRKYNQFLHEYTTLTVRILKGVNTISSGFRSPISSSSMLQSFTAFTGCPKDSFTRWYPPVASYSRRI